MIESNFVFSRLLAELLRLQKWTAGESVSAARIYGLMHGFEESLHEESSTFGVSRELQRKVEDVLDDVGKGVQATDGPSIKERLQTDGIDELDASRVMTYCILGSRFGPEIEQIADGFGSIFPSANKPTVPEKEWLGPMHYVELIDFTSGQNVKLHSVHVPSIPRIGELVTPQNGEPMIVVGVEHVIGTQDDFSGTRRHITIPQVMLEPLNDVMSEDEDEDED